MLRLLVTWTLIAAANQVSCSYMKSSDYTIQRLKVANTTTGESPCWDVGKQILYYVDIAEKKICCYKYKEDKSYCAVNENPSLADNTGFIVPVTRKPNNYVIGVGTRICEITWVPPSVTFQIVRELVDVGNNLVNRINDGKADSSGRLYFGTMNRKFAGRAGAFYRLSKRRSGGHELVELFNEVGTSNGLTWSKDRKKMFYIDSKNQSITGFDYDLRTGDITKPRTIINTGAVGLTIPDGMTTDVNDRLYAAIYNGNCVVVVNPKSGRIEHEIKIPDTTNTTSVAFGGPHMNELFVTSGFSGIESMRPDAGGMKFCKKMLPIDVNMKKVNVGATVGSKVMKTTLGKCKRRKGKLREWYANENEGLLLFP